MAFRINLEPAQFWRLTPREFQLMIEAFNDNEKAAHDARAWTVSTLICALGQFKRKPNPRKMFDELSGRAKERNGKHLGNEKIARILQESRERVARKQAAADG